jgi:hypothetical protein
MDGVVWYGVGKVDGWGRRVRNDEEVGKVKGKGKWE